MAQGGARPGAGRKAVNSDQLRVQLGARVLPGAKAWLEQKAEEQGVSVGRIIENMIFANMA
jgi:hypothetical protein